MRYELRAQKMYIGYAVAFGLRAQMDYNNDNMSHQL